MVRGRENVSMSPCLHVSMSPCVMSKANPIIYSTLSRIFPSSPKNIVHDKCSEVEKNVSMSPCLHASMSPCLMSKANPIKYSTLSRIFRSSPKKYCTSDHSPWTICFRWTRKSSGKSRIFYGLGLRHETWRHGDMETWRHGDMETIFLPLTISWEQYLFSEEENILERVEYTMGCP